ncbi:MAG: hypothetical protein D6785_12865, partial [Planctomycetota bacterium]
MKLLSLELKNWKSFRKRVQVSFSPSINLIYGPNETG